MPTLRLIIHAKAACEPAIREAVESLRGQGHKIDIRVTWEGGHAALFAQEAAGQGIDIVVAGGGDGTINEVVQGLLSGGGPSGEPPALAILPLGTANDFARALGIPVGDPLAALKLAAETPATPIDVGLVNGRSFINVASGGFGAEVTSRTPQGMKDLLGGAAYSITGLLSAPDFVPYACRLTVEGRSVELSLANLSVCNSRHAGGGFEIAPQARLDDGLLDLVLVPAVPLANLPALVSELFQPAAADNQYILYHQVQACDLEFASDFPLNLDGEPLPGREFHFSILPGRIRLCRPT